jgi:pimeloyl-ACP methyl ester carboxylesterase
MENQLQRPPIKSRFKTHLVLAGVGAFVISGFVVISASIPAFAAKSSSACPRDGVHHDTFIGLGTDPSTNQISDGRPIIFVHGWTGRPLTATKDKVMAQIGNGHANPFLFDYSKWASYWASNPNIAACLADYVNAVSNWNKLDGGDGKVIIVAHSMGGLAIRYATGSEYVSNPIPAGNIASIVTIDTPYLGSPFGNTSTAALSELWRK